MSPSLWLSFERLENSNEVDRTAKAGTWQTLVVETDVVTHPVEEGGPADKDKYERWGKAVM